MVNMKVQHNSCLTESTAGYDKGNLHYCLQPLWYVNVFLCTDVCVTTLLLMIQLLLVLFLFHRFLQYFFSLSWPLLTTTKLKLPFLDVLHANIGTVWLHVHV